MSIAAITTTVKNKLKKQHFGKPGPLSALPPLQRDRCRTGGPPSAGPRSGLWTGRSSKIPRDSTRDRSVHFSFFFRLTKAFSLGPHTTHVLALRKITTPNFPSTFLVWKLGRIVNHTLTTTSPYTHNRQDDQAHEEGRRHVCIRNCLYNVIGIVFG